MVSALGFGSSKGSKFDPRPGQCVVFLDKKGEWVLVNLMLGEVVLSNTALPDGSPGESHPWS